MNVWRKLSAFFRRKKLDADMAEEMRLHLELQTRENIARGMSPQEAHYAAQRAFGGVEQIKEQARDLRTWVWLEQLLQDIRFGRRALVKSPGFTCVAVLSLAIGIGLNTAVFSIINTLFYQTIRGVPEPRRVMFFNAGTSPAGFGHLREAAADVMSINASHRLRGTVEVRAFEREAAVAAVSGNYFSVLQQAPVLGRLFALSSDPALGPREPEVVLEHGFWQRELGGDPAMLGEVVRINRVSFTVIGIARGTGIEPPPLMIPLGAVPLVRKESSGNAAAPRLGMLGRLQPGITREQAQVALDLVVAREPELFAGTRFRLSAGREDWRGEVSQEKRVEKLLVTVVPLVVVGGLLWIACSNVSNLLLARAVQRQREIAVRVASGASRGRLVRMMMAESLVLALLGGTAGLWVSGAALDFVFATLSQFGSLNVQIDGAVLLYTMGISIVSTVLFGLVPALRASRVDINSALKGEAAHAAFRPLRLRRFLLASQIASSIALLVVAGTFVKTLLTQLYANEHADVARELLFTRVAAEQVPAAAREEFYRATADRLRALPGVAAVTLQDASPLPPLRLVRPDGEIGPQRTAGPAPTPEFLLQAIDAEYGRVMPFRILRGAALSPVAATGGAVPEALANEAAAALASPAEDAVGRVITFGGGRTFRVIGVVRDTAPRPTLYSQAGPAVSGAAQVFVRTRGAAENVKPAVVAALRNAAAPEALPQVGTYREVALRGMSELTRLACFVGVLALALAASGIHAAAAFDSSQRTREIGLRVALGATRGAVLRLLLIDGARTVAWGSAFGTLAGIAGLGVLSRLMFGRWVTDGVALAAVVAFFALVALLSALWPALRATKVDPMTALRAD